MKGKLLLCFLGVSVISVLIAVWVISVSADKKMESGSGIILKVSSDKQTYVQGEIVKLTFEATNKTDKPVFLSDVSNGYLKVWIAYKGERFNQYKNSGWGRLESGKYVKPGESYTSQATVLWNVNPIGSYANVDSIVHSEEGAILSDYAFPTVGVYLVKALLYVPSDTLPTKLTMVESKPIEIIVNAPSGDNLQIWNKIKDSREVANFMHRGGFFGFGDEVSVEKNKKTLKEIETLVQSYPNGILAEQLKAQIERFNANENLRKLYLEKKQNP